MMYGNYGRRMRDSRGRYMEGRGNYQPGNYSARGRGRGNYRGEDMIDEMRDHYMTYEESKEEMNRGNYGAEGMTMKALEYMLALDEEFIKMLIEDAKSPEEREMIEEHIRKMNGMM